MAKKKMTFEDAVLRIEEIVESLENEEVSLEKSIALYKEGMDLSVLCQSFLLDAKTKVVALAKNSQGEIIEKELEEESWS